MSSESGNSIPETPEKQPASESSGSIHSGHRKRVRDRFLSHGCRLSGQYYEHQVLEMLLFYTNARGDVNPLAHKLIDRFGSLYNVLNADISELARFGLSENTIMLLKLANAIPAYAEEQMYRQDSFSNLDSIMRFCFKLLGNCAEERVCVICLGAGNRLLHYELLDEGSPDKTSFPRRRITEIALRYHAVNLVIAHNHPSKTCVPSSDDIESTQELYQLLRDLDINLVEHIIVANPCCYAILKQYTKDLRSGNP